MKSRFTNVGRNSGTHLRKAAFQQFIRDQNFRANAPRKNDDFVRGLLRNPTDQTASIPLVERQTVDVQEPAAGNASPAGDAARIRLLELISNWGARAEGKRRRAPLRDFITAHVLTLPYDQRPWAHEIRAANLKFYSHATVLMGQSGARLRDLFPIHPDAAGGSLRNRKDWTPEEALAELNRRREHERLRKRRQRARAPTR